jgi:hypothetical protein
MPVPMTVYVYVVRVCVCMSVRMSVQVCVCTHMCVCVCAGVQSWAPNPRFGGLNPTWAFQSSVTLSKSLYPHCSSVTSGIIGTWLQLGWQKGQKHLSHQQCHI